MSLLPYVSDLALRIMRDASVSGWIEVDGTLAFFDISGFTRLTERLAALGRSGAEDVNDILTTAFEGLIGSVMRRGGDVLEFGGDAMVVLFAGAGHERNAAIAAAETQQFMATHGRLDTPLGVVRLRMSCGMATGTQAHHGRRDEESLDTAGPVSTTMTV